jgi:hypothetical protein
MINNLPDEILQYEIFPYLDWKEVNKLKLVCINMRNIIVKKMILELIMKWNSYNPLINSMKNGILVTKYGVY